MATDVAGNDVYSGDGRVALLTNAGFYVGPSLAWELARTGHALVLHGAEPSLVDELVAAGVDVEVTPDTDLRTETGNAAVVQAALDRFGRIDAACFTTGSIVVGPFADVSEKQWAFVKSVNLDMAFHALQAVLPPMAERGSGQVVVITSATGANPQPFVSAYSATRAGANALVRAVGLEYAASGVQVNAVGTNYMDFPGFIAASGADDPERRAKIEAQVPMRRLGTMEEFAAFLTVLLDGRSRFQTGQFFSYSGGWSA